MDIFECSICFNEYNLENRLPRHLDCQHTLCSECLLNIQKNFSSSKFYVKCPTCKTKTKKRLEDIPRSLLTIQLMDATKYKTVMPNTKLEQSTTLLPSLTQQPDSIPKSFNNLEPSSSPKNTYQVLPETKA